jgi:predicted DNA repair protein MutK
LLLLLPLLLLLLQLLLVLLLLVLPLLHLRGSYICFVCAEASVTADMKIQIQNRTTELSA